MALYKLKNGFFDIRGEYHAPGIVHLPDDDKAPSSAKKLTAAEAKQFLAEKEKEAALAKEKANAPIALSELQKEEAAAAKKKQAES